jgi:hypothetical protein
MCHEVLVERPSTAITAAETSLFFRRLPLSNKSRDELCTMLVFQLESGERTGPTVAVAQSPIGSCAA